MSSRPVVNPLIDLSFNRYGKIKIRLVRIDRSNPLAHSLKEVTTQIALEGDFSDTYFKGDNKNVVPTDTMKNTVYFLSKNHFKGSTPIEEFAQTICRHFLKEYSQVKKVLVVMEEHKWDRMQIEGKSDAISFIKSQPELRTCRVSLCNKGVLHLTSGITGLTVLKTQGSGFAGYPKCKLTTLKEVTERVFCTSITSNWSYNSDSLSNKNINFDSIFTSVRHQILEWFSQKYSNSVQQVEYETGLAILERVPEIDEIYFAMPNIHILLFDVERFGLKNQDEIYYPTDDPSGFIEATITRKKSKL